MFSIIYKYLQLCTLSVYNKPQWDIISGHTTSNLSFSIQNQQKHNEYSHLCKQCLNERTERKCTFYNSYICITLYNSSSNCDSCATSLITSFLIKNGVYRGENPASSSIWRDSCMRACCSITAGPIR